MRDPFTVRLLAGLEKVHPALTLKVRRCLDDAALGKAITLLSCSFSHETPDRHIGVLLVHWLHQTQAYAECNAVLDAMIGLNLSERLKLENCPDESTLMSNWTLGESEGVSIVCTTYNHARFIGMALASFFSQQTRRPFEVIVRDDASSDGTSGILDQWQARYPRLLRIERHAQNTYRQGIAPMPAAIKLARYPLVAICEGDDFWVDPEKIERQASLLCDNPSWSAVFHNHFELNEASGSLRIGRELKARGFFDRKDLIQVNVVLWLHTIMFRQSRLHLPAYSHRDGILGDQIWTSMLGAGGPVFYLGDLIGSVARRNLSSTYTPLSEAEKQLRRIKTKAFLAEHQSLRGEAESARRLKAWSEAALRKLERSAAPARAPEPC